MGHFVFIIGPLYLAVVAFIDYQLLRWLAFVCPALRRKPDTARNAAARAKGERAAKRAAEPRLRTGIAVFLSILYIGTSIMMPIGFFLRAGLAQKILRRIGYCMVIVNLYLLIAFILYFLISLILRLFKRISRDDAERGLFYRIGFSLAILAAVGLVVYGEINARIIKVKHYEFSVAKDGGNIPADENGTKKLRIALIADQHLGYNAGLSMMKDMVAKVNAEKPDFVFLSGDVFDNAYEAIEKPDEIAAELAKLESTYGTYAVFGNHDVEDNLIFGFNFSTGDKEYDPRYEAFLEKANATLLKDEVATLFDGSLYIVGRRDIEETGLKKSQGEERATAEELTKDLDKSKILIDLEHEPKEVDLVQAAGFDMQLSGHTHNGQFFPLNLFIGSRYFNACGYKVYGDTLHTVTTSGVGSYGPFNRAFTDSEFCIIDVTFQ